MNESIIRKIGLIFIITAFLGACAPHREEVINNYSHAEPAPVLLPGTASRMNTAGFWIGAHPDPDRIVIPGEGIVAFNRSIRHETKMVQDLTAFPDHVKGNRLANDLKGPLREIASRKYVRQDGKAADRDFFKRLETQMNTGSIPQRAPVRFGIVTTFTAQRLLPTDVELFTDMKNTYIDRLQNSSLDIGTPVAVVHLTRDRSWAYAISPTSEGWVSTGSIGFCSRRDMTVFLNSEPFIVTVAAKADLFLDESMRDHHAYARMGCRFPVKATESPDVEQIQLPFRDNDGRCVFKDGFVSVDDVTEGYLSYTPRTIIIQAFKLLNSPYGWGDMHGEQDCSRFIDQVFSTVGICLPRNSRQQAKVGKLIARFNSSDSEEKRLSALSDNSLGGTTILQLKGHIMLFLGNFNGDPYAIHDMLEYSEPSPRGERKMIVNRVVVSNLMIGEGTRSGAFLKRLVTVRAFEAGSL